MRSPSFPRRPSAALGAALLSLLGCSESPGTNPSVAQTSVAQTSVAQTSVAEVSDPVVHAPAPDLATVALPAACNWDEGGRGGLPVCPNTGQDLPTTPVEHPGCTDRAPGAVRWLGTGPVTPLAIVEPNHAVRSAGQPCCSAWARTDQPWRGVGPYGEDLGAVRVEGGEGYDVTRCYELSMSEPQGGGTPWAYASTVPVQTTVRRWEPGPEDVLRLEAMLAQLTPVLAERPADDAVPLPARVLYFETEDELHTGTTRYAMVGGHALVVARLSATGFVVSHVDNTFTNVPMGHRESYLPVAALDMDGDGLVEVVYRWNEAASWGLVVLGLRYNDDWRLRAQDLGGATI